MDPYIQDDHLTYEDYWARGAEADDDFAGYEGCPQTIWEDEEEGVLLDPGDIDERDCPACRFLYQLWERVIEDSGDKLYGQMAFYIMDLDADLDVNADLAKTLPAWEHEMVKLWRSELNRFERSQVQQSNNGGGSGLPNSGGPSGDMDG